MTGEYIFSDVFGVGVQSERGEFTCMRLLAARMSAMAVTRWESSVCRADFAGFDDVLMAGHAVVLCCESQGPLFLV